MGREFPLVVDKDEREGQNGRISDLTVLEFGVSVLEFNSCSGSCRN